MILEVGKLYQVKHWSKRDWVLAEYVRTAEPHVQRFHNIDMSTLKMGKEQTRNVPRTHYFKSVARGSSFGVTSWQDIREASIESVEVVKLLRANVAVKEQELTLAKKELREFSGE